MAIAERLAKSDPGNAGWQRDLSCRYEQGWRRAGGAGQPAGGAEILPRQPGDQRSGWRKSDPGNAGWQRDLSVSLQQGWRCAGGAGQSAGGAEIATATASRSGSGWRNRTPATPAGSAICRVSYNKVGDVLVAQGNLPEALKSYRDGLAIRERLAQVGPRQRRLAARSVGQLRQGWRRAGGAGQSAGGAEIVSRRPRHHRAAGDRIAATPAGSAICRVSYDSVGDVLVAQGNLPEALKSFATGSR